MELTEKRLIAAILVLASLPPSARVAETAAATKLLGELHARAGQWAEVAFAKAELATVAALGDAAPPEPWLAFLSLGPGKPPPAIELMRPAPEVESTWWTVFKAWTSVGQMYTILFEGEMPKNEVNDLTKTVTMGTIDTAVAGAKAATEAAGGVLGVLKIVLAGGITYGGYQIFKKRK